MDSRFLPTLSRFLFISLTWTAILLITYLRLDLNTPPTLKTVNLKLSHVFHRSFDTFKHTSTENINPLHTQSSLLLPFAVPYKETITSLQTNKYSKYPDPTDPQTVLTLSLMTLNAYFEPEKESWVDIPGWNTTTRFGWENDGIRGYVFADTEKNTVIITFKGLSYITKKK